MGQPITFDVLRQRGAALLMLLGILGVGAAALLMHAYSARDADLQRERMTARQLGEAREALIGFALRHGRLPRPAISGQDGRESTQACENESACTGLLPWRSLGIARTDAWGKQLQYSVAPIMSSTEFSASVAVADKRLIVRSSDGQRYPQFGQRRCELSAQCAPAVIFSTGAKNFGNDITGRALANGASGNADELHNAEASNDFLIRARTLDPASPGGEFDDMVVWVPLVALYQQMARARALH